MDYERLLPEPRRLTPADAASNLSLGDLAPADRPYVALNMVATLDGKATIGGRSGPIGGAADRELFDNLRTQVDAVMAGAGTIRTERYGRIIREPKLREKRVAEGLDADARAIIVSGSLNLPTDLPILQEPEQQILILTTAEGELQNCAAQIEYLRTPGPELELGNLLPRLRADYGVRSILGEGGPTLNGSLFRDLLVDEIFLSLAPKLAGAGEKLTIVAGRALPETPELDLVWLDHSDASLFLRGRVRR